MPNSYASTLTPPTEIACPSEDELRALIDHDLTLSRNEQLTAHIGDCTECQEHLDRLATKMTPVLNEAIKNIDQHSPPAQSALWKAIDKVVVEVTRTMSVPGRLPRPKGDSFELDGVDDDLAFLTPTSIPGRIGTFGDFEIVRLVGRGGMGVVLHAFDTDLRRDVALKVLSPELSSNRTARQRFCREARAAASVSHENIVAVHQVNEDGNSGLPFLVMQLITGESLEQRLRSRGKLSVKETVILAAQAAWGLAAAHSQGLIHRDIKPGNILIEEGHKLKLTDFGLARAAEDLKLTKTGYVSGTPLYMAPEQARGEDIDARADLFSLGVVMYESLAGRPPFEGKTPLAVLRRVADDQHDRLSSLNPSVPEWLEDVIDALLSKKPEDRIASAAELAKLLHSHSSHSGVELCESVPNEPCSLAPPKLHSTSAKRRYRRKVALLMAVPFLAGLGLGFAGAVVGFSLYDQQAAVPPLGTERMLAAAPAEFVLDEPLSKFESDSGAVWSTDTCNDGKTVAVGLEDGHVRLFDITGAGIPQTIKAHTGPVWSIDFHPDSQHFVTASDDGLVKYWDLKKLDKPIEYNAPSGVRTVAFSPIRPNNGAPYLAFGDRSGSVEVVDLESDGNRVFVVNHGASINSIAFHQKDDALLLATAGTDKTVRIWNVTSRKAQPVAELTGHKGPVYAVAFSPNGELIATAGWDRTIKIWATKSFTEKKTIPAHGYDIWSLAFDHCEGWLASAGQDGTVRVWDPESGEEKQVIRAHKPVAHVVRFAMDGKSLISGGRDGAVRLWTVTATR